MNISKNEQIAAILEANEWELAEKCGVHGPRKIPWSITKKDVYHYIAQYGFPKGWVYFSEQTYDGIYLLQIENEWSVSYKERGIIHSESKFATKGEAMDFLLDEYYLKRNGIS